MIDITGGDTATEKLTLIVDHQVQLEAKEPVHRGAPALSNPLKNPMLVNPVLVTDG